MGKILLKVIPKKKKKPAAKLPWTYDPEPVLLFHD